MLITSEEETRRRLAWRRACVSSQLEGLPPNPQKDAWMEGYFLGERSEEATFQGLVNISNGLPPEGIKQSKTKDKEKSANARDQTNQRNQN